jgi:oxygen-dependent protoporphyrinogen oxidase
MKALYPTYLGLEQKKGSLTGPSEHPAPPPNATGRKAGFLSLRRGMESLIETLRENLGGVDIRLNAEVGPIQRSDAGFRVAADGTATIEADALIIAAPAYVASCILREIAPEAGASLLKIKHTSTAVATLAYDRAAFPKELHGNGFLVPYTEKSDITGCTWSSNKWEGRAPEDTMLIRCFMGRDGGMNVDDFTDEQLIERAKKDLDRILKPHQPPVYSALKRWTRAMPQKVVGHTELLEEIDRGLAGLPVQLIGASFRSSGIPDCVRDGREAAAQLTQESA